MTTTVKITSKMLRSPSGMEHLTKFEKEYPDGLTITPESIPSVVKILVDSGLGIEDAHILLSPTQYEGYNTIITAATAQHYAATEEPRKRFNEAWVEVHKVQDATLLEPRKVWEAAQVEPQKIRDDAWAKADKAYVDATAEQNKVLHTIKMEAFLTAFLSGKDESLLEHQKEKP